MSSSISSSDRGPLYLLSRAALFALLPLAVLLMCWCWGPHVSRVDYLAGLRAKHQRLTALGSPKVVLIGGSNVTFGMDSRLLEKVLCRPVVNMSIHASLGLRFMVDELKGALGPGDLVIAPLEYSAYSDPIQDNEVHLLAIDFDPELIRMMPITARPRLFLGVMVMRAQATWKVLSGAWKDASPHSFFRADGFNEQGDLVSHLDKKAWPSAEQEHVHYKSEIVDPEFWPVIAELGEDVRRAGATLVIAWPGVAQSSYREGRADSLRMALQLKGLSILGEQARYVLPDSSFFDTHYHLRSEGREMRTLTLVEDLCGSGVVRCCSGR